MVYYMLTERPTTDLMDLVFPSVLHPFSLQPTSLVQQRKIPLFDTSFASEPQMKLSYDDARKEYCVSAPTPGIKREDLKIEVVGRHKLEVTIDHKEEGPAGENKEGDKMEVDKVTFVRKGYMSVTLPKDADTSKSRVEYSDGLLKVYFPSSTPEDTDKRMRIADEAHADLAKDYTARCEKVKELREQLEKEMREAAEAQERLREARYQEAQRIASERKQLTL